MGQYIGLARLGNDAVVRMAGTDSVCNLSLAFSYGKKGEDGNRPTQWVDASLWGARADSMAQYLLKGTRLVVTLDDLHIETFPKLEGQGIKLVARVSNIEFAGDAKTKQQGDTPAPRQSQPAPHQSRQQANNQRTQVDLGDNLSDCPF